MTAITLTNHELLQLKLLLRDIQLIQKMNSPFDDEAIEILSFKIIEHLNNHETYGSKGSDETKGGELATFKTSSQTEISDEEIEKASKYWNETTNPDMWTYKLAWKAGAKWYREQLKNKQ